MDSMRLPAKYRRKAHLLRPPVPHLFHSNRTISDEEYDLIRATMDRVRAEIVLLKELERAEGDNDVAYRERLACEAFLAKHETGLHWTRRLSPELLVSIFICCAEENTVIPWSISQVCRKWRSIALSMPQLWRKIPLRLQYHNERIERRFLQFLKDDYIGRSGKESIIFIWNSGYVLSAQLYAILAQHAERWGDIHLGIRQGWNGGETRALIAHLQSLKGSLHSLYSLKLVLTGATLDFSLAVFKSAPRLRYLLIDAGLALSPDPSLQLDWPWNQVTHFSGTFQYMDVFNHVALAKFTNLVYIKLHNCLNYFSPISDSVLIFPACKFLSLKIYKSPFPALSVTTNLLKAIYCPLLERFHITYYIDDASGDMLAQVAKLVQRHANHLTSLHWQYDTPLPFDFPFAMNYNFVMNYDVGHSIIMVQSLRRLKILRITEPSCKALEKFLTMLIRSPSLFPSLEKLDMGLKSTTTAKEIVDLCYILDIFVKRYGPSDISGGRQQIQEVRLEVPQRHDKATRPFCMTPWEIVMQLEGWAQDLQEGWEKQVKLESELKIVRSWAKIMQTALDKPSDFSASKLEETLLAIEKHDVTEVLVLHASFYYASCINQS